MTINTYRRPPLAQGEGEDGGGGKFEGRMRVEVGVRGKCKEKGERR